MMVVRTPADVGAAVHAARTTAGRSQQQIADEAGVSRRFVSLLEGGSHANAELWRVLAVLTAVGIELTTGAGAEPNGAPPPPAPEPPAPDGFDLGAHLATFRDDPGPR